MHALQHTQKVSLFDLHAQVELMVSHGIMYTFPSAEDGQQSGQHHPNDPNAATASQHVHRYAPVTPAIDLLHAYAALPDGVGCQRRGTMSLVLRQMLAREVQQEIIRRADKVSVHQEAGHRRPMHGSLQIACAAPMACRNDSMHLAEVMLPSHLLQIW